MSNHNIDWYKVGADILGSLESVEGVLAERGIDPGLHHLMLLRASQINKCPFCVKMHSRDARKAGESDKRLDHLVVWRHVNDFSDKEKAAFAWVEKGMGAMLILFAVLIVTGGVNWIAQKLIDWVPAFQTIG